MLILLLITQILKLISSETSSGGLSEKSYYIEDVPTLNVEALELLSNNNISNSLNEWKDSVLSDGTKTFAANYKKGTIMLQMMRLKQIKYLIH